MRRVVITGLGAVTPLGCSVDKLWEGLINGRSGIGIIEEYQKANYPSQIGGRVSDDFNPTQYMSAVEVKRFDRFITYGLIAACMAYDDSGLNGTNPDMSRIGSVVGSGIGGIQVFMTQHEGFLQRGYKAVSPFFIPLIITNMLSGQIAIKLGLRGPNFSISSACATSNHSIGTAFKMIQSGVADIMFAGGAEAAITNMGVSGFIQIKALSERNSEPQKASRPFDKDRDGFVMGDGAGVLILEELEMAKKRGAKIYGEIIGMGMSDDAYNMVAPHPEGEGASLAMEMALQDAKINADQIDYINMHGTSTIAGDIAEVRAVKKTFKDHAHKLCVSSTKSMVGHMLGAAGAVELIATLKMMETGIIHPTINVENQDPECDLDIVPNKAIERGVDIAMSNSFGFGGHNGVIVVKKYS